LQEKGYDDEDLKDSQQASPDNSTENKQE